ncbi:hypothetical protein [Moraxella lacunata]
MSPDGVWLNITHDTTDTGKITNHICHLHLAHDPSLAVPTYYITII